MTLDEMVDELATTYIELGQVRSDEVAARVRGYMDAAEGNVSLQRHQAEIYAVDITKERHELEGKVESLKLQIEHEKWKELDVP